MSTIKVDTIATRTGSGNITASNTIAGNLTGNVTGNVTGNLTGNSTVGGTLGVTGLITASAGMAVGGTGAVNTLDDYEEGNWTPVLKFGGGTTGITYNTQIGRYTKIGRLVQVNITIYLSSKGSSTGVATITGLPFATAGTQFSAHSYDDRVSGGAVKIQLYNNGNSTQLQLFEADDDQVNNSQIQQDSFSNTAFLIISMQYYVD